MTGGSPPWATAWLASQQELLEGWPAVARSLWEALQRAGSPAALDPDAAAGAAPGASAFTLSAAWPALGPAREDQEAWERLLQRVARLSAAQSRLAAAWVGVLQRSLATLSERVLERAAAGKPVETLRALYDLWVEAAESAYAAVAHASPYVELQAELANATSELRISQREYLERWAREYDLPTRTELDAVHHRLKELAAALRALDSRSPQRPTPARQQSKPEQRPSKPARQPSKRPRPKPRSRRRPGAT